MRDREAAREIDTAIIGGSQSGLAVGFHLKRRGRPFVILDEQPRIGDAWRARWDSLRLFSPRRYSALPGMRVPGSPSGCPTKDEIADYLEAYAREFDLPVRTGVHVDRLSKAGGRFQLHCGESTFGAANVVVATGASHTPRIPPFADELDAHIVQLHSRDYRNPSQLQRGSVLVVGAGNSGADIAMELAARGHRTWISGRDTGHEPARPGTVPGRLLVPFIWFIATRVLTLDNAVGRKVCAHFTDPPRGIPLARVRRKDFAAAGITSVPRTTGVSRGYPLLEDGRVLEVSNVVWCTGFLSSYDWIELSPPTRHGIPIHDRGIVRSCPGLYFVGLNCLYALSSSLVGGVGRDAGHIVEHLESTRPGDFVTASPRARERATAPSDN